MVNTFPSIQKQNLCKQVVQHIGLSIIRNDFKPGETLWSEHELSQQFQVSRPILREALRMLSAKGLIETRPKTGTRIRPRSAWNLLDPDVMTWQYEVGPDKAFLEGVCEIRLMIEPRVARLAATRASVEERMLIAELCQLLQTTTDANTIETYISADLRFHDAIYAAAHNELLQSILNTIREALLASRIVTSHLPDANRVAMPLHWAVTEAISAQDAQAAEIAMQQLVALTTSDIQRALETRSGRKES
jgi:DNA-binding FadR family transcriptional regulator